MTYKISTYDPVDDFGPFGWNLRASGLKLFELRRYVREFRRRGYDDDLSILVERESSVA